MKLEYYEIRILRVLICFFIFLITQSLNHSITPASAAEMKSGNWKLETGGYNIGTDKLISGTKVWQKLEATNPLGFEDAGYIIQTGFPYTKSALPFGFAIANTTFDLGPLTKEKQIGQMPSTTLTVTTAGAASYQVLASENHPLRIIKGTTTINDTSCDNPDDACTQKIAKIWTDNSKYGLGYNLSGQDIPTDFLGSKYFRCFSNEENLEEPAVIMTELNPDREIQATITLKALAPDIQAAGVYDNIVTFLAIPGY